MLMQKFCTTVITKHCKQLKEFKFVKDVNVIFWGYGPVKNLLSSDRM